MNLIGDLKVYAIRNGQESFYNIESIAEGKKLINDLANADLKNDAIEFNCFGILIYEGVSNYSESGWIEWTNDDDADKKEDECVTALRKIIRTNEENRWLQQVKATLPDDEWAVYLADMEL